MYGEVFLGTEKKGSSHPSKEKGGKKKQQVSKEMMLGSQTGTLKKKKSK